MEAMADVQRKMVNGNSTTLSRKWLTLMPYFQPPRLSDNEILTGLHSLTLVPVHHRVCFLCGGKNKLGHDEIRTGRNRWRWTVRRHGALKNAFAKALSTLISTSVDVEPSTLEGQRRNDIHVRGRGPNGGRALDYDVKIYSLLTSVANKTTTNHDPALSAAAHALPDGRTTCQRVSARATNRPPEIIGDFRALVVSVGGLVEMKSADELKYWRRI